MACEERWAGFGVLGLLYIDAFVNDFVSGRQLITGCKLGKEETLDVDLTNSFF